MQETYLQGLSEDPDVPFKIQEEDPDAIFGTDEDGQRAGPLVRENVDAGVDVIDLAAMKAELEAGRAQRR